MTKSDKKSDKGVIKPKFLFSLGMEKDERYQLVKLQIGRGKVTEFNQIFKYIPKSIIARDLGTSRHSFNKKISRIEKFTFEDVYALGRFMEVKNVMSLFKLVHNQYLAQKGKKKK